MVATLYLNSFTHYSSAFVISLLSLLRVGRKPCLDGGVVFLPTSYRIAGSAWLDGSFIESIREERSFADSSTGLTE